MRHGRIGIVGSIAAALAASLGFSGSPFFASGYGPRGSRPKGYRTINRLNRSRRWRPARDYQHARAISPYPDRPVR